MKITNTSMLPTPILQSFNENLLCESEFDKLKNERKKADKIDENMNRRTNGKTSGKVREYYKLKELWFEEYVRAESKKEKYETTLKNAPKMPSISNEGVTMRFKRFRP